MQSYLGFNYKNIVADAGYESEENYLFIEENGQTAFIKPANYEIAKTRKYKQDISRIENMDYNKKEDVYLCRNGKKLSVEKPYTVLQKQDIKVKKRSTNVRTVQDVHIKKNASEGTTVKHLWKNGQNVWKHRNCSWRSGKRIWNE